ncbi:MAG: WbqC family protein [bacterium]
MIVSINQPAYLPWLGYFERIARSDAHIVLDHVQFEKNSFTNRNKVRTREGFAWLTVPIRTKGRFGDLSIAGLSFAENDPWQKKHWATLRLNYSRTPFFASYATAYEPLYEHVWDGFGPMVRAFLAQHVRDLGISTPLLFSSELGVGGTKSQLILNLCKSAGATTYLSGPLGRNYLDEGLFLESGISVVYQDYTHPTYTQHLNGFEPFMCILDLIFNHGPDSRNILMSQKH